MQEIRRNESLKDLNLELLVAVFKCVRVGVFVPAGERGLTNATGLTEWFACCCKLCKITIYDSICLWLWSSHSEDLSMSMQQLRFFLGSVPGHLLNYSFSYIRKTQILYINPLNTVIIISTWNVYKVLRKCSILNLEGVWIYYTKAAYQMKMWIAYWLQSLWLYCTN